jgi:hypothetical protein
MKESLQTRSYGVDDKSMEEGNEDVIEAMVLIKYS